MVDAAAAPFVEIHGNCQVNYGENVSGYLHRKEDDAYRALRKKHDHGENDARHGTGSTKAPEMVAVAITEKIGQGSDDQRAHVQQEIKQFT